MNFQQKQENQNNFTKKQRKNKKNNIKTKKKERIFPLFLFEILHYVQNDEIGIV